MIGILEIEEILVRISEKQFIVCQYEQETISKIRESWALVFAVVTVT
jgi:hypothetical protein